MENQLTIEQALHNIRLVLDNHVGKKQEHTILDQSYNMIVELLKKEETKDKA